MASHGMIKQTARQMFHQRVETAYAVHGCGALGGS
jgi:hypothetical protein